MQVQSISFHGVYRSKDKQFSPIQYTVSEKIKNRLTSEDYMNSRGYTPAEILKKQGYDIIMTPVGDKNVSVTAVTGLKKHNDIKEHSYRDSVFVGEYNADWEFEPKDITQALNNRSIGAFPFLIPVLAFAGLIISGIVKSCNGQKAAKSTVENVIANDSLKAVSDNTINFLK